MPYIVKWVPKDQDRVIDHSTPYHDPSRALEFASNILELDPKKVWIEDERGPMHTDYEAILKHSRS
jgi:hypothetical protein